MARGSICADPSRGPSLLAIAKLRPQSFVTNHRQPRNGATCETRRPRIRRSRRDAANPSAAEKRGTGKSRDSRWASGPARRGGSRGRMEWTGVRGEGVIVGCGRGIFTALEEGWSVGALLPRCGGARLHSAGVVRWSPGHVHVFGRVESGEWRSKLCLKTVPKRAGAGVSEAWLVAIRGVSDSQPLCTVRRTSSVSSNSTTRAIHKVQQRRRS